ncbi:MAG: hypothetical protein EBZ34_04710, partial [Flavobacteriia bacterium]|nr:hypothetical protein [Flavobacteriia bacterium]
VKNAQTAIVHVQYIDHFGQLVTNANRDWLKNWHGDRPFVAVVRGRRVSLALQDGKTLSDGGQLYHRINRYGYLEIGITQPGSQGVNTAASLLGANVHDPIELQRKG